MKKSLFYQIFTRIYIILIIFSLVLCIMFIVIYDKNSRDASRRHFIQKADAISYTLLPFFRNLRSGENDHLTYEENLGLGKYVKFIEEIPLSNIWIVDDYNKTIHVEFGKFNISYSSIPKDLRQLIDKCYKDGKTGFLEKHSQSIFQESLVIASPIKDTNQTIYGVTLVFKRAVSINSYIKESSAILLLAICGSLPIALIPSLFFSNMIVLPLKKIKKATDTIIDGDYSATTGVEQQNEVGVLAKNIDELSYRLLQAQNDSNQAELTRKRYISNISHELRTPVSVIRGSLETLCDKVITDPKNIEEYQQIALNESIHLESMVNDLLELSRLQSPDYKIVKDKIDLCQVVQDAARMCRPLAKKRNRTIKLEEDIAYFEINADYSRIRQMFITVLDNAIKFSYENTDITIKTQNLSDIVKVSITNYGDGIDEKDLPYVFNEYYMSLDRQNSTGTGLGLAICSYIAKKHDINIYAKSNKNDKTSFYFEFKK